MQDNKEQNNQSQTIENNGLNLTTSSTLINNPSDFLIIQNPLVDLNESQSAIIHIKNTCKNSFCNCYVNFCFGHSVIYNTFLNTQKGTKYLFQSKASILSDCFTCYLKDNVDLLANFKSVTKSNSEEITLKTGNLFVQMIKNQQNSCFHKEEEILMPVHIIPENRIAGIVKLLPNQDLCGCPCCHCFPYCSCCPCKPCCDCDCCKGGCCNKDCCKCPKCPCCDPKRCCCGLCRRPDCPCCDPNRCCCGLCPKCGCFCFCENGCCCTPTCCNCCKLCSCCQCHPYRAEILYPNKMLKYYIFNTNICGCGCKCLKRKSGLNFDICDANKNPICTIKGRNNENFGTFFKDSYSYEINFPQDAEPDIKLTLLNCVYALDALCIY